MKKIADISLFENLLNNKSVPVNNSIYRDWYDNGENITVVGDLFGNLEVYGRLVTDCNTEDYANSTRKIDDINYRPINMSRITSQIITMASDYYEEQSIENGKLLDLEGFVGDVKTSLLNGLTVQENAYNPRSEALNASRQSIDAICGSLYDYLMSERSRIAKEVRKEMRWGRRWKTSN